MAKGIVKYIEKDRLYRYMPNNSLDKKVLDKVMHSIGSLTFVGNFFIKGFKTDGYLYELDSYDKELVKNIPLKENEYVFRYTTYNTAIGGMTPLIKINKEKLLAYFGVWEEDEKIKGFTKKGEPIEYLNLVEYYSYSYDDELFMGTKNEMEEHGMNFVDAEKTANDHLKEDKHYYSKMKYIGLAQGGLIAPNGKKSNLTPEQYKLVRTPEFKKWFGDWENDPENASKVVDANGEPKILFHRSKINFYKFDSDKQLNGWLGKGFYFSESKNEFKEYGNKLLNVFLNVKNPFVVEGNSPNDFLYELKLKFNTDSIDTTSTLINNNFDGIIYKHWDYEGKMFTCFNPNQIKLADGTNTQFNSESDDIRYAQGGEISVEIVNKEKVFNKDTYEGIYGDTDHDGLLNADDPNPNREGDQESIEQVQLADLFSKLLSTKKDLDKTMYEQVDKLKEISPKGSKIYARTKTPYSILNKLINKRMLDKKDPSKGLTDMVGTTIVAKDFTDVNEIKDKVKGGALGKIVDFDDYYSNPKDGYMAYHFIVVDKDTQIPFEVQLKTKRMKLLNQASHNAYKYENLDGAKLLKYTRLVQKADEGNVRAQKTFDLLTSDLDALSDSLYKDKTKIKKYE